MAPRHVLATAHGGACYLKWQNGFAGLGAQISRLRTDTMGAPLLPWRHNSGARENTNVFKTFRTSRLSGWPA